MDETDRHRETSAWLAMTAAGCFAWFVLALALLHLLRPDYTVVDHMISDYAVGRYGWIMTTAFASAAIGCLVLGIGLLREGPKVWLGRAGAGLLIICALGLAVTAIFPTDLETAPSTRTGDIHAISFLVNIFAVLFAAIALALSYRRSEHWRRRRAAGAGFAALLLIAFLAQFFTLHKGAPYGLTNRAFVAILMAWLISTSLWLRAASRGLRS
jgi:hypothetical membrane protein